MKKKPAFLAVATLLFLAPQLVIVPQAKAVTSTTTVPASRDGIWDIGGKSDTEPVNYVGNSENPTYGVQKSAIQFQVPPVDGTIKKATLRIHIAGVNDGDAAIDPYLTLVGSTNDAWGPAFPMNGSDLPVFENITGLVAGWKEFDVTSYVNSQLQDRVVTFALLGNETGKRVEFWFDSDNATSFKPELVLEVGTPDAQPPVVASTTIAEDTSANAIVMSPIAADSTVTHYKITEIIGGRLYLHNGTTEIHDGDFITAADGTSGLKFTPRANDNSNAGGMFSFKAQAAQDNIGTGLSIPTQALITVTEVNDAPVGVDDTLPPIDENSAPLTIPFSQLINNDTKGNTYENAQALTIVEPFGNVTGGTVSISGNNVIFTPDLNFHGAASFQYTVHDNGWTNGSPDPKTSHAIASFTVNPRADMPNVTNAITKEDEQTTTGLVLTPTSGGGAATSHFKISEITGGTLFQHNGSTPIHDGDFITLGEGGAGLKYTPNANANGMAGFTFKVQAAPVTDGTKLSDPIIASINVTEVNDAPDAVNDALSAISEDSGDRTIPFATLLANDSKGAPNESGQSLTVKWIGNAIGGTVQTVGTDVIFTPTPNYYGAASFEYDAEDNGTTDHAVDRKTDRATVSFMIDPRADIPIVTSAQTAEDTPTSTELVITRNASDGVEITHFKITGIMGGTLYQHNGATPIQNGDFITFNQGAAGLTFTPAADANTPAGNTFSFKVQAALDGSGTGLSEAQQAVITVSEVNDAPDAVDDVLADIAEDSNPIRIPIADLLQNDSKGAGNESGQTLTLTLVGTATGGEVTVDGTDLVFTPTPNYFGAASFQYDVVDDGTTDGTYAAKTDRATVSFLIRPEADKPSVTNASTTEDAPATNGLVITANPADGASVTHFKISEITGGTLYQNNGATVVQEGEFITFAQGGAGLTFTPAANDNNSAGSTFSFKVHAALDGVGTGLSTAEQAVITVTEVNDAPVASDDVLSSVNENSGERTIPFAALLGNDMAGPGNESGQTLTITSVDLPSGGMVRLDPVAETVIFTPATNYRGTASFRYTVEDNGTTNGTTAPLTNQAVASFTIDARADQPSVTDAATAEDAPTTSGLVITPTSAGGATTTHFKISEITGGTLYQNDGMTRIHDGDFITVSEGGAGLKFTPLTNAHGMTGFGFMVQAAPNTDGTLLSDTVAASITVSEVNDEPVAQDDALDKVKKGTAKVTIPFSDLTTNDLPGPSDEQWQTFTVTDVSAIQGGTVSIVDGHVEFLQDATFSGTAKFTYTVRDNGRTNGSNDYKSATAAVSFYIVDEDQPIITLNGDNTVYLLKGQPFTEPGFAAYDDADKDLTDRVSVTGAVDKDVVGTYVLHYNVADNSGNPAPEVTRTVQVVSNDLAALSVGTKTLTPAFDAGQQAYTLKVPTNEKTVTITASAFDPTATLTIDGVAKGSGGSQTVSLKVGKNTFAIVVTAQGGTTKTYTLEVTRQAGSGNDNGNGGGNGGGNGHGSWGTRHGRVVTGADGDANVVQVDITRSQTANGKVLDSVELKGTKVEEVVAKAVADHAKIARIVIDDVPGEPADEVGVNVSADALSKLKAANLGLVIEASGAKVTLSVDTLRLLSQSGQGLYFHLVPVRKPEEKQQVEHRVLDANELKQFAHGRNVRAVGQPMTIETNYTNRKTKVMLPLTGIEIPTDPHARQAFLNGLAVFVEHNDGQKEVEFGRLVYDDAGHPVGLEIEVEKFSTFTFISTDADFKAYFSYISGYPDGTFHPSGEITRAEMASLIARQMETQAAMAAADRYPDVSASHWAAKAVLQVSAAGILAGDVNGTFRPEQPLTRAEMAVIAAKLKKLDLTEAHATNSDAQGHWAAAVIAAVQKAGLMVGFEDGTFRPNQALTRAEATAVLNRLFGRPALKNQEQATWPDVPLTDWAAPDIESASHDIRQFTDGRIEKNKE